MRARLALRHRETAREAAFVRGLSRCGYQMTEGELGEGDLLIVWNRFAANAQLADRAEAHGARVLVAENALWGNDFLGQSWLSLSERFHNTPQKYREGRWDRLGVELPEFRCGGETVILAQRGIGHPSYRQPNGWAEQAAIRYSGRIRRHPGNHPGKPLQEDVKNCGLAVTWASGAAVKCLLWGIPVISEMPNWVAHCENTVPSRLEMFRRLASSQWTLEEIGSGDPFHG